MIVQILFSLGIIGAILLFIKHMMDRARTDRVLGKLQQKNSEKQREAWAKEVGRVEQEIKDAKIAYDNARRNVDESSSSGGLPGGSEKL